MLIGFVHMYVKIIDLFFIKGPHLPVLSAETTHALATYICSCKF